MTGTELRDEGMAAAVAHANQESPNWIDVAFAYLRGYALIHKEFMAEEVRAASHGLVPEPPSKRAWGAVFMRAAKENILKRKGFRNVTNPKAHSTPATLWEVI